MDLVRFQQFPRVMFYSHDGYGLGHISRTLTLARYFRARWPAVTQLIVTGSPLPHNWFVPQDADYIKLPSVAKLGAEEFVSRSLVTPFEEIRALRRDILLSTVRHFEPSALIVDYMAAGLKGELVPALRYLKDKLPDSRLILGLRDVVDKPSRVRRRWARDGVYELLDDLYDLILVYGQLGIYDVVAEYGLSPIAAAKTRYVGYLRREEGPKLAEQIRAGMRLRTNRLVVVTAGGGGDGYHLLRAVLEALRLESDANRFDSLIVAGPFMPADERRRLGELILPNAPVRFLPYVEDLASYVAAADAVVSMGGYNSICEILSFGRPAVVVPRVRPSKEQLIRAKALRRRGLVRMIHPADLTPGLLLETLDDLLQHPVRADADLNLNGLVTIAAELEQLLSGSAPRVATAAGGTDVIGDD
jgi:predicted glycosyltransferase